MAWLADQTENNTETKTVDEKWLKIPDPVAVGKTTEVQIHVLDEEPVGIWRHWLGSRVFNCPGIERCPVCKVRMDAKKNDPEGYKERYRMDYRYYFNVLFEDKVKVWSFTNSVGRKLKMFEQKYGDLRDYDISVSKRKTGSLPQNVEYDIFFVGNRPVSNIQDLERYDRSEFVQPANAADLSAVARGELPEQPKTEDVAEGKGKKASKASMIMLKALVEKNKWTLGEFGIVESSPPAQEVVDKLITELSQGKA